MNEQNLKTRYTEKSQLLQQAEKKWKLSVVDCDITEKSYLEMARRTPSQGAW